MVEWFEVLWRTGRWSTRCEGGFVCYIGLYNGNDRGSETGINAWGGMGKKVKVKNRQAER